MENVLRFVLLGSCLLSVIACHKRSSSAQEPQDLQVPTAEVTTTSIKSAQQVHFAGKLKQSDLNLLNTELEKISDERTRVKHLKHRLKNTYFTVSQLAELLELFDLEVARLEAIELLHARLIEGDQDEERHILLDLFEDSSNRARAVDLLGWH